MAFAHPCCSSLRRPEVSGSATHTKGKHSNSNLSAIVASWSRARTPLPDYARVVLVDDLHGLGPHPLVEAPVASLDLKLDPRSSSSRHVASSHSTSSKRSPRSTTSLRNEHLGPSSRWRNMATSRCPPAMALFKAVGCTPRAVELQPSHNIQVPVCSRCRHRFRSAARSTIDVQILDHVQVTLASGAVHRPRRARLVELFVQPLDDLEMPRRGGQIHRPLAAALASIRVEPLCYVQMALVARTIQRPRCCSLRFCACATTSPRPGDRTPPLG